MGVEALTSGVFVAGQRALGGAIAVAHITVFRLLYGGLAPWRRSLRPGIAAHAWTDVWSGWLAPLLR